MNKVNDPTRYLMVPPLPWPRQKELFEELDLLRGPVWCALLRHRPTRLSTIERAYYPKKAPSSLLALGHERPAKNRDARLASSLQSRDQSVLTRLVADFLDGLARFTVRGRVYPDTYEYCANRIREAWKPVHEIRNTLIASNMGLVARDARRLAGIYHVEFADMMNEGSLGLAKAVDKFDLRQKRRFSTYGSWWVKASTRRALHTKTKQIRVPVHWEELGIRARFLSSKMTTAEIARACNVPEENVRYALNELAILEPLSADAPVRAGMEHTFRDRMVSPEPLPDAHVASLEDAERVLGMLRILDPRSRQVVRWRFGLDGSSEHTLDEIGKKLGISRERVRQIVFSSLESMRTGKRTRTYRRRRHTESSAAS